MDLKKTTAEDIIKEHGLPEDAKCLGYVVHLPVEDEFLGKVINTPEMTQRFFTKTPDMAKVYSNHKKAIRDAKKCKQDAIVCLLFDVDDQYAVLDAGMM